MKDLIKEWSKKYLILEGQYDEDLNGLVNPQVMTNPKTGEKHPQFTINPKDEKSFKHKDVYKKHGAKWFNGGWTFTAWDDNIQKMLDKKIKPTLEEIAKMEGEDPTQIIEILSFLENEMKAILSGDKENVVVNNQTNFSKKSAEEILQRLDELKKKLIDITSAEDFKEFMRPILKFRNTKKQQFSFGNTILIWLQDPKATFVQSIGNWDKKYNRNIKGDAKLISLYVPIGQKKPEVKKDDDTDDKADNEEENENNLKQKVHHETHFRLLQRFTDIRFTTPIEGKEDKLKDYEEGRSKLNDLKWHEDGTVDEELKTLINAVEMVCKDEGINIEKVKKEALGGALGVSMNGGKTIKLIDGQEVNEGFVKTAVHELTHSLCHWENSKFKLQKGYSHQEQEAEMCAWAVLCVFGYEATTDASMNYIGAWGLTEKTAKEVFERMSKVITYIVNKIQEKIDTI